MRAHARYELLEKEGSCYLGADGSILRRRVQAGAIALHTSSKRVVLGSVPVGNPSWSWGDANVDSRMGRAFILDDGVLQQQVTLSNGGGYSWSGPSAGNKIHIIDTRTGRLVMAIDVPQSVRSLAVDAATGRVFAFDQGQIEVIDARGGALLNTVSFNGDPYDASDYIDKALVDERSGHAFATVNPLDSSQPTNQHLLMLNGWNGRTLRNLSFPHGQGVTTRQPNGSTTTYYGASLSLALDGRAGRLYVFNTDRQMSVVDTRSGRRLSTRFLPVSLVDAQVDERTGRIFAFSERQVSYKSRYGSGWMPRTSALVMLDPRTGTIRTITPVTAPFFGGPSSIAIAEDSNRVFVLDSVRRAVDVLDGTSGRLVRTVVTDGRPLQLALDGPHHRALVTTFSGYSYATMSAHLAVLDTRTGALRRLSRRAWRVRCTGYAHGGPPAHHITRRPRL